MEEIFLKSEAENKQFLQSFPIRLMKLEKFFLTKLVIVKYGNDFMMKYFSENSKGKIEPNAQIIKWIDYPSFEHLGKFYEHQQITVHFFTTKNKNLF